MTRFVFRALNGFYFHRRQAGLFDKKKINCMNISAIWKKYISINSLYNHPKNDNEEITDIEELFIRAFPQLIMCEALQKENRRGETL